MIQRSWANLNTATSTNNSRGFTIVELLIVIIIIGILAAIIIVAYNGMTNRAKSSKSSSTMSSILKKIESYAAENGSYPTTYSALTGAATSTSYYIATGSYTLKTASAVTSSDSESSFNLYSCTTPAGYMIQVYDYSGGAVSNKRYGGATSASTCTTLITS